VRLLGLMVILLWSSVSSAETVRIAVASNFYATLKQVAMQFTQQTHIPVHLSNGATGMLYAQIKQGAPFDLYFSADSKRPQLLEQEGLIEPHSRFTYAVGQLVAWFPFPKKIAPSLKALKVKNPHLHFLAIANPKTAPYGVAGQAVLKHYGLLQPLMQAHKLVRGENIGKTFGYVASGNAQIGLVAKSYLSHPKHPVTGVFKNINPKLYPPILQQAVILKGHETAAVNTFLTYFKSNKVQKLIVYNGYGLPTK